MSLPVALWLGACALWGSGPSEPEQRATEHGSYWVHRPAPDAHRVLVAVHGMVGEEGAEAEAARQLLEQWTPFAQAHGLVVVAPVFDDVHFASRTPGALGGYRSLVGRVVAADAFLHEVLADVAAHEQVPTERFLLFGHSAGGQFANRYLVTHPGRVAAAVISAPAWFAFPDPDTRWPHGMAPRRSVFSWGEHGDEVRVDVTPRPQAWRDAAAVPTLVVVGEQDRAPLREGSPLDHVTQARAWVEAMGALGPAGPAGPELLVVPDVGHNQGKLLRAAQPWLAERR